MALDTDEPSIGPVDNHCELGVWHPKVEWNEVHRYVVGDASIRHPKSVPDENSQISRPKATKHFRRCLENGFRLDVHVLLPDNLHQHPLWPPAVEFAVEDLLQRAEVELAFGDGDDH